MADGIENIRQAEAFIEQQPHYQAMVRKEMRAHDPSIFRDAAIGGLAGMALKFLFSRRGA